MNILFLDIDGVLITEWSNLQPRNAWFKDFAKPFSPESVEVINQIIEQFDLQIVLTSDWKYVFELKHLIEFFEFNNINAKPKLMPYDYRGEFRDRVKFPNYKELRRTKEISTYITEFRPSNFLIIDDLDLSSFGKNFVRTEPETGLTKQALSKIYAAFGKKNSI